MALIEKVLNYTAQLAEQGLLRSRTLAQVQSGVHFDSNDYLSLRHDPLVNAIYAQSYARYPAGSGGSMVLSGYHANHRAMEQQFAQWLHAEDCLFFSSGYAANLALTALAGQLNIPCVIDKAVHASIYDGLALNQVSYTRYVHNQVHDAEKKLKERMAPSLLITEGIFSMSGQISALDKLAHACKLYDSGLIVDEAHSIGVLGDEGQGAVAAAGLHQDSVPLRVIPLGKAFAAQGALIAGDKEWIHALIQAGRSFIYSTAPSPALASSLMNLLELVRAADKRREKLRQLVDYFKQCIKRSPLQWNASDTAIQQLKLGATQTALYYEAELKQNKMYCSAIRTPTVPLKECGLRVILNAGHEPAQIDSLFNQLDVIYERTHH